MTIQTAPIKLLSIVEATTVNAVAKVAQSYEWTIAGESLFRIYEKLLSADYADYTDSAV